MRIALTDANTSTRNVLLAILLAAPLALFGCGGDDDPTDPGDPGGGNGGPGSGDVTAEIDGANFNSVSSTAVNQNGVVVVAASSLNGEVGLGFGFVGATTGTYTIGPGHIATANVTNLAGEGWNANINQGSGAIVVTTLNATRVAGTFEFTAPAVVPGTDPATRVVTEGVFDVEFPSP